MKKLLFLLTALGLCTATAAQEFRPHEKLMDLTGRKYYAAANAELKAPAPGEKRVVFLGNSITHGWAGQHPEFFASNGYIGRGIGGQGTVQMLMRFQSDVVALQPVAVVINCGTNDIAENVGPYDPGYTMECIRSMVLIARGSGIEPILSSVLPAGSIPWNAAITGTAKKVLELNKSIKAYAKAEQLAYIDYHSALRNRDDALDPELARDGVHPTGEAYIIMEKTAKEVIDAVLSRQ